MAQVDKLFVVGVTGLLLEDHTREEISTIHQLMDEAISHSNNIVICSNLINRGISKIAYDWAYERAIPTMGIAPGTCWEHPVRMVEACQIAGEDWGDEIGEFTDTCDGLLNFWQTDLTLKTVKMMEEKGKRIIDLSDELANRLETNMHQAV